MKKLICLFIINLIAGYCFIGYAQDKTSTPVKPDSVAYAERYGLRIAFDLSKPIRSFIDKKYTGFEVGADYRLKENLYPAAEIGYEDYDYSENYFSANSKGEYLKLGINLNVYKNWLGMQNEIYVGFRYGISSFSETLNSFTINDTDHYFPPSSEEINRKYSSLSAQWLEFQGGIKVEVLHNVFLGVHVELKRLMSSKRPDNFANLWIPGFERKYESNEFGVGWGYTISYLLPLKKKIIKNKL